MMRNKKKLNQIDFIPPYPSQSRLSKKAEWIASVCATTASQEVGEESTGTL